MVADVGAPRWGPGMAQSVPIGHGYGGMIAAGFVHVKVERDPEPAVLQRQIHRTYHVFGRPRVRLEARLRQASTASCWASGVVDGSHLDLAWSRFRLLRNDDLQHAVAAAGGDAFRVRAVGQGEAAMEHAMHAFGA